MNLLIFSPSLFGIMANVVRETYSCIPSGARHCRREFLRTT